MVEDESFSEPSEVFSVESVDVGSLDVGDGLSICEGDGGEVFRVYGGGEMFFFVEEEEGKLWLGGQFGV